MSFHALAMILLACWAVANTSPALGNEVDRSTEARQLASEIMIVDTHIDVPYRLEDEWEDVTKSTENGDFDYVRARQGGLDVPFMSIYTPPGSEEDGTSYQLANKLIDSVEALVGRAPDKFVMVSTPDEAVQAKKRGLMGLAMGMENGSPIDGDLGNLTHFRDRGISYITLTHGLSNHISDSSYDEERQWKGLSPFGKTVVSEMNRLGIMIDVSHISDEAFFQVIELSKTPVIASHSSARHFTPDWERNMSDEMITSLAANGGVIQVNLGSSFLTGEARDWYDTMKEKREAYLELNEFDKDGPEAEEFSESYRDDHPFPFAAMRDVVANFQHIIGLVGIDHVGIGSDYDGVGDSLPVGMKDVSTYPALIEEFLRLEYSNADITAIMSGNLMRVWKQVENFANSHQ